jgi:hypothetical protein
MGASPPDAMIQHYVAELRRYLTAHPRAADTFTGVAGFWLAQRPRDRDEILALELALEQLVSE